MSTSSKLSPSGAAARSALFNTDFDAFNPYGAVASSNLPAKAMAALRGCSERLSHWLLRLPLAALIWGYGVAKFPAALTNPGDFGVPAVLYVLNAFGEVLGVAALLIGGVIETWKPRRALLRLAGDLLTRAAGFALAAAIGGVIVYFLWETITLSNSHTMQLGLALFFLLRGNRLGRERVGVLA